MFWCAWQKSGALAVGRKHHTATLLDDGRVLVAGGYNYGVLPDTEIWSPATGRWASFTSMMAARSKHAAVKLLDGRVLVVGGEWRAGPGATSEIWDPRVERWGTASSVATNRSGVTLTLLSSGSVLAIGGSGGEGHRPMHLVEEWNPVDNAWRSRPGLTEARFGHTATLLRDGRVLVVGGAGPTPETSGHISAGFNIVHLFSTATLRLLDSAEIWDPRTGQWEATGPLQNARAFHAAAALLDGRVVVIGGAEQTLASRRASTEIWDPARGAWTRGPDLPGLRYAHTATTLEDGRVLVTGGEREDEGTIHWSDSRLLHARTGAWRKAGGLRRSRSAHTATLLADGRVLLVGGKGCDQTEPLRVTEIWRPR